MVRSLNPIAHIECRFNHIKYKFIINTLANSSVVSNLFRFVNEFWFLNLKNENIEEIITLDSTNSSSNSSAFINKVKIFKKLEVKLNYIHL